MLLQVPQALITCLPLARLRGPQPWELLTGLAAALFVGCSLASIGLGLSARFPRVIAARAEPTDASPASLTLLSTAIIIAHAVVVAVLVVGLGRFAPSMPWAPAVAFGVGAACVFLAHARFVATLGAQIDAHREQLVETLG